MGKSIQKRPIPLTGEIMSLNIEDLDIVALEQRLEMAVAVGSAGQCIVNHECSCQQLTTCGTFCS
jgi:hypothetical protein